MVYTCDGSRTVGSCTVFMQLSIQTWSSFQVSHDLLFVPCDYQLKHKKLQEKQLDWHENYVGRQADIWFCERQQSGVYRYHSFILFTTMDTIQQCLSLTSVPCLIPAFSALKFIWSDVEQAQVGKTQLGALAQSIAQLLLTLDGEYRVGRLQDVKTSMVLADLCRFVISSNAMGLNV